MIELFIEIPGRSYMILIGKGILTQKKIELKNFCPHNKAVVVSDTTVWELYGGALGQALTEQGVDFTHLALPPGENNKSMRTLESLFKTFYQTGLTRNDPIIALGGGVIGDLAGFAASTYMRGVPFIQIPTTLLAQVDASVGGKVAINMEEGKNLIGSFYQPKQVIIDPDVLSTLTAREWNAGMAEVIKYAALGQYELLSILENHFSLNEHLEQIIYLCCKCKAEYVEQDEKDYSVRMMLNFGHTFGHALEKYHAYSRYNHGEAVAIGMALAARAGALLEISEEGTEQKLLRLMEKFGLNHRLEDDWEQIIPLTLNDKKNFSGGISLVLLRKMGEPIIKKVLLEDLMRIFREEHINYECR
ncbi:MAG: 3-dehydroquinate synthase [Syntrophomonadaceae bacterium]|jgi:3-dehydroquinate synthase|nr:3-dehydroquinate synthase [Syntrophomonadaceae bacterium]